MSEPLPGEAPQAVEALIEGALARVREAAWASEEEVTAYEATQREQRVASLRQRVEAPRHAVEWLWQREARRAGGEVVETPWERAAEKLGARVVAKTGGLVGICGPSQTGKTCLAVAALWRATERLLTARYVGLPRWLRMMNDAGRNGSASDEFREWCRPWVLVLDNVEQAVPPWQRADLWDLLNERYNRDRLTLVVAEGDEQGMGVEGVLGASLTARLNETGGVIRATWGAMGGAR